MTRLRGRDDKEQGEAATRAGARSPYETPRLLVFGNLHRLTLGGSPDNGDSGGPMETLPILLFQGYGDLP